MYEFVFSPLRVPFGVLLLGILLLGFAVYWFARRSAKHPESAARSEARLDAGLEALKSVTPASVDLIISQVQALDLTSLGRDAYARGQPLVRALEDKAAELLELARHLKSGSGLK